MNECAYVCALAGVEAHMRAHVYGYIGTYLCAGQSKALYVGEVGQCERECCCCCHLTQFPDQAQDEGGGHWGGWVGGAIRDGCLQAGHDSIHGDSPARRGTVWGWGLGFEV